MINNEYIVINSINNLPDALKQFLFFIKNRDLKKYFLDKCLNIYTSTSVDEELTADDIEVLKLDYITKDNLFNHYYNISLKSENITFEKRMEWIVGVLVKDIKKQNNISIKYSFVKDFEKELTTTLETILTLHHFNKQDTNSSYSNKGNKSLPDLASPLIDKKSKASDITTMINSNVFLKKEKETLNLLVEHKILKPNYEINNNSTLAKPRRIAVLLVKLNSLKIISFDNRSNTTKYFSQLFKINIFPSNVGDIYGDLIKEQLKKNDENIFEELSFLDKLVK